MGLHHPQLYLDLANLKATGEVNFEAIRWHDSGILFSASLLEGLLAEGMILSRFLNTQVPVLGMTCKLGNRLTIWVMLSEMPGSYICQSCGLHPSIWHAICL